jgi:lipopolysaccharide transport system permease protein
MKPPVPTAAIAPREGASFALAEVLRFRELIAMLVARDLKVRYKRSVLGMLWSLLNPLLQMVVYSFVFSTIMRLGVAAYPIFLLSGLLPWTMFSTSVSLAAGCLLSNASLIRKVAVPQLVYPLALVGSKLVDLLLSLIPLILLAIFYGRPPGLSWLFLPVAIVFVAAFSAGISFLVSSLTVFFRDMKHLIDIFLQIWFYLTPVIYTYDQLTHIGQPWVLLALRLNPATPIVRCFQQCLYEGRFPPASTIGLAAASATVVLVAGLTLFLRAEPRHIHYL